MNEGCDNPQDPRRIILDPIPPDCGQIVPDSLKNVGAEFHKRTNQKTGYGQSGQADPMQTGQIVEDLRQPKDPSVIYRYSKALRGCDEAVKDLFSNLVCISEAGEAVPVPVTWGTQERAVAAVLQSNVRQDSTLVVNRINLPMLSVYQSGVAVQPNRYIYHKAIDYYRSWRPDGKPGFTASERRERDTVFGVARGIPVDVSYQLTAWTSYMEDMNQILEQVLTKFSPVAYIRIQGVHNWETIVKIDSVANNLTQEPGDQQLRVIKFQFGLTAETFIPQPIVRKKAVLHQKIDIVDRVSDEEITEVISRLETLIEGDG